MVVSVATCSGETSAPTFRTPCEKKAQHRTAKRVSRSPPRVAAEKPMWPLCPSTTSATPIVPIAIAAVMALVTFSTPSPAPTTAVMRGVLAMSRELFPAVVPASPLMNPTW